MWWSSRPVAAGSPLQAMITYRDVFSVIYCWLFCVTVVRAVIYTDQWAVHISGGPQVANDIASRHGYVNLGPIVTDYYHFQHRKVAKRSAEPSAEHNAYLLLEPNVLRVQQQELKRRVKRDLFDTRQSKNKMNDPLWPQMWYLNRGNGLDMNVQAAWNRGVTGKGVVVTILDDGLEKDHPDIKNNYDPLASYDVNNHDEDPQPRYDFVDSNRHGTRCAGEVAADANNSICAVGIAYEAKVGGVRMLDGDVTDAVEARSLSLNPDHIDIYSASWGPDDDGKTVDGPGELATRAFMDGILHGRNGLGSIFVWASGNGGRDHDNCNCDGYTNSIWTLSISSATENGLVPWYSEACSSTLATTYSSGSVGEKQVVTTDLHYSCTATHTGTSASAPLAAGVCALALQVNPKLTWRDMQHIVVRTARPANLKASDWQTNGAGLNVSHSFGYGLMDAAAMVDLAKNWTTVPPQEICEIPASHPNKLVPAKSKVILPLYVDCPKLRYLEHVQAKISMSATRRGDIQIFLKSPSGTSSCLLDTRPHDTSPAGFHNWPFMTVHNWGENPQGIWMLEIHNEGRYEATITNWNMVVYGTKGNSELIHNDATPRVGPGGSGDESSANGNNSGGGSFRDSANEGGQNGAANTNPKGNIVVASSSSAAANVTCITMASDSGQCLECGDNLFLLNGHCVADCPESHFKSESVDHTHNSTTTVKICLKCHYTCKWCSGPNDYQCRECFGDAQLDNSYCRSSYLMLRIGKMRSYAYAITISAILFGLISISVLVFFICWPKRKAEKGRFYSALPQVAGNLIPQPRDKARRLNKGFLDLEDANEDSQEEI